MFSLAIEKAVVGLTLAAQVMTYSGAIALATDNLDLGEAPSPVICESKACVKDLIEMYAKRYGTNVKLATDIARCESEFRTDVYGDSGKAYGVFQFHKPTFDEFAKKFGDELDYKNTEDNIKLAVWALAHGKANHWSCYAKVTG
ncbi:MAG: transglycosylase SLT domain-containing protein [Patescibacteria group bacterium]